MVLFENWFIIAHSALIKLPKKKEGIHVFFLELKDNCLLRGQLNHDSI